jgi:hypothetical protein
LGRMVADRACVRMGATLFPGSGRTIGSLERTDRQKGSLEADGRRRVGKPEGRRRRRMGSAAGWFTG